MARAPHRATEMRRQRRPTGRLFLQLGKLVMEFGPLLEQIIEMKSNLATLTVC